MVADLPSHTGHTIPPPGSAYSTCREERNSHAAFLHSVKFPGSTLNPMVFTKYNVWIIAEQKVGQLIVLHGDSAYVCMYVCMYVINTATGMQLCKHISCGRGIASMYVQ